MPKKAEQLEKELQTIKGELNQLASRKETMPQESVPYLIKELIEQRERTNKLVTELTGKVSKLQKEVDRLYDEEQDAEYEVIGNREVPLSGLDTRVLDFVQSRGGMICAEDLMQFMKYKGRNAACSRLNKLYRQGLLERHQLGHKVFYKFDAGKAANTLIISPPQ